MPFNQIQLTGHNLPPVQLFQRRNDTWHPLESAIFAEARTQLGTWEDRAAYMRYHVDAARARAGIYENGLQHLQQRPGFEHRAAWDYYARHGGSAIPYREYHADLLALRSAQYGWHLRGMGQTFDSPYYIGPSMRGVEYFGRRW